MRIVNAYAVICHSEGAVTGLDVFSPGPLARKEAREQFVRLVAQDLMESGDEGEPLSEEEAVEEARKLARRGSYTSESGDFDVLIVKAENE